MRTAKRAFLVGVVLLGGSLAIGTPGASAQSLGSRSPLGGYGAASSGPSAGMGGGGSVVIPFGGNFVGFMPYRMGGNSSLSFGARSTSAMDSSRAPFSLAPMSGAMSSMSRGISQGAGTSPRGLSSFGLQGGMGLGGGMREPSVRPGGMSVMPPSFGYPFYQPPSLLSPSTLSAGMSM
jgi:hypothetical protein